MVRQQRRSRYGQSSRPQDLFEEKEEGQKRGRSRRQEEEEEVAVSTESTFDIIDGNSKADRKARFFYGMESSSGWMLAMTIYAQLVQPLRSLPPPSHDSNFYAKSFDWVGISDFRVKADGN